MSSRRSLSESWAIVSMTASALGEMVSGQRGTEDLGGPIRIAQMSGEVAQAGVVALLWVLCCAFWLSIEPAQAAPTEAEASPEVEALVQQGIP